MGVKKIHNRPKNIQALYYVLIFIAGIALAYEKSKPDTQEQLWFLLLMFGIMLTSFYKATQNWAYDNPKPPPGENDEEETERPEIKDVHIPSLEEMSERLKNKTNDKMP